MCLVSLRRRLLSMTPSLNSFKRSYACRASKISSILAALLNGRTVRSRSGYLFWNTHTSSASYNTHLSCCLMITHTILPLTCTFLAQKLVRVYHRDTGCITDLVRCSILLDSVLSTLLLCSILSLTHNMSLFRTR